MTPVKVVSKDMLGHYDARWQKAQCSLLDQGKYLILYWKGVCENLLIHSFCMELSLFQFFQISSMCIDKTFNNTIGQHIKLKTKQGSIIQVVLKYPCPVSNDISMCCFVFPVWAICAPLFYSLTDKDHKHPPKIGTIITYKFQEYTNSGTPRFPSYIGIRIDMDKPKDAELPPLPVDI